MPFPGNMVPAPVMAARQGMKDIAFGAVTDQGTPVAHYVDGALTGQGSGLLTPATQTNTAPAQGNLTQTAQAAGKAVSLGRSTLQTAGGSVITSSPASAVLGHSASALGAGSTGSSAIQPLASFTGAGAAGASSAGAASPRGPTAPAAAAPSSTAATASPAGITPGMRPAAPQFTPLPSIPSMPALSGVMARLGGLLSGAGAGAGRPDALSGVGGSGASAPPATQFAGTAPADATEAEFD